MTAHSSLASVSATRKRLAALGLTTKKYLGQHFLIDDGIVGKILRLAALAPNTRVLEIGPGIGTLTEALLAVPVRLTAVELDEELLEALNERYPELQLRGGDALDPSVISFLRELAPAALVANLPYAVAATLLLEYFQQLPSLEQATVMVQSEVADRIAAEPNTKAYGAYTVKLSMLTRVAASFTVSPQCFYPPPRVSSTVIRLERDSSPSPELLARASMLADAAFFQRRKTIRNSMRAYGSARGAFDQTLDSKHLDALLAAANIDPTRRGETLSTQDFLTLASVDLRARV